VFEIAFAVKECHLVVDLQYFGPRNERKREAIEVPKYRRQMRRSYRSRCRQLMRVLSRLGCNDRSYFHPTGRSISTLRRCICGLAGGRPQRILCSRDSISKAVIQRSAIDGCNASVRVVGFLSDTIQEKAGGGGSMTIVSRLENWIGRFETGVGPAAEFSLEWG
jgi:hypothetical protein